MSYSTRKKIDTFPLKSYNDDDAWVTQLARVAISNMAVPGSSPGLGAYKQEVYL